MLLMSRGQPMPDLYPGAGGSSSTSSSTYPFYPGAPPPANNQGGNVGGGSNNNNPNSNSNSNSAAASGGGTVHMTVNEHRGLTNQNTALQEECTRLRAENESLRERLAVVTGGNGAAGAAGETGGEEGISAVDPAIRGGGGDYPSERYWAGQQGGSGSQKPGNGQSSTGYYPSQRGGQDGQAGGQQPRPSSPRAVGGMGKTEDVSSNVRAGTVGEDVPPGSAAYSLNAYDEGQQH